MTSEKPPLEGARTARFTGNLRHYHRAPTQGPPLLLRNSKGQAAKTKARTWPKVVGIVLGLIVLASIAAGLVIELSA